MHWLVCDRLGRENTDSVDINLKGELQGVAPRGFPGKGDSVRSRSPVATCLLMRMVRRRRKARLREKT